MSLRSKLRPLIALTLAVALASLGVVFSPPVNAQPQPGPKSELFLTSANDHGVHVVHHGEVVRWWERAFPSPSNAFGIAVSDTIRTSSGYGGVEYELDGTPTGARFTGWSFPPTIYDGATDGSGIYTIDSVSGAVYRHDLNWAHPFRIFERDGGRALGITYDPTDDTLWVSRWNDGDTTIEHLSLDGTLIDSFDVPVGRVVALAFDPADETLWFGTQTDLAAGERSLYQYSRAGDHLQTIDPEFGSDVNFLGGEFALVERTIPECTIEGTESADVLVGTGGPDVICGFGGNDEIRGRGGDDVLLGGEGNDRIFSGPGDDVADGGHGHDRIFGGDGDDRLAGGIGRDQLFGHADDDRLFGGKGDDRLAGGAGLDLLDGGNADDRLHGENGADILNGGNGHDVLFGGNSTDSLGGGQGNDYLDGGGGPLDMLTGGPGMDTLRDIHGGASYARGGGASDTITITIPAGWTDSGGLVRLGWVMGGYGNDIVRLTLERSVVLTASGDEHLNISSPREGTADELIISGQPLVGNSLFGKFEVVTMP